MSSRPARWIGKSLLGVSIVLACPALNAQDAEQVERSTPTYPQRVPIDIEQPEREEKIDLLVDIPDGPVDQRRVEQCVDAQDAATLSGEIVVCRDIVEDNSNYSSGSREAAQDRYAQETAWRDAPATPNVDGEGITGKHAAFGLGATIRGCIIPPCPPPPALIIDGAGLPEAPSGSEADRIARGLEPLGEDDNPTLSQQELLGLPDPVRETLPTDQQANDDE